MGNFFKKIVTSVQEAATLPVAVVKPPPPHLLMPHVSWDSVWKSFEPELRNSEIKECSNKLRMETNADRVKEVKSLSLSVCVCVSVCG